MLPEKFRTVAIAQVAEYLGIAAEFVVDDAIEMVAKNPAFAADPELQKMYFFVCLGKILPPEVPYQKIKEAITKASGLRA